jgi:GT2 family glycosyltransferase
MNHRIAIIIINYRTPQFTCQCLRSLFGQVNPERDCVVIVDNASGDGSDHIIEKYIRDRGWNDWIRLKRSPINGGFSAGNNIGIQTVDAEYYLLLNSDTIVRAEAIDRLIEAASAHPKVGLISPRLEWPDAEPQESCFRHWSPTNEFFTAARTGILDRLFAHQSSIYPVSDHPIQPDWVSFACVLIRRKVFDRVGLLDECYFMYFDDMDFCRRAWNAGITTLHWPDAHVVHLRGGSGPVKKLAAERKRPPRYWYASRNRYYAKFYGRFGLWLANCCWYGGRLISLAREAVGLKQPHTCNQQWIDIWTNALNPLRKANRTELKEF